MTREQEVELIDAFNRGWTGKDEPPALDRLRVAWAEASTEERETFKAEIYSGAVT